MNRMECERSGNGMLVKLAKHLSHLKAQVVNRLLRENRKPSYPILFFINFTKM